MTGFALWMIAAFAASLFCLARGVLDCRRGHYVWGVLGIASGLVFMLTPIPTHEVKVDLAVNDR